jgi:hypothetical protein
MPPIPARYIVATKFMPPGPDSHEINPLRRDGVLGAMGAWAGWSRISAGGSLRQFGRWGG